MLIARLKSKLGNKAGETIAETLVSLLIAALALTMLAGAIMSASNMIRSSRKALNKYYQNVNALTVISGDSTGKISFEGSGFSGATYNVTYVKNGDFSQTPVVAYKYVKTNPIP